MNIYMLSFWRSHLSIVAVDLLPQEPARTVGDPFTAYVPGEVTEVSRMTDVHPKFLEESFWYSSSRPSSPGTRLNRGVPFASYVPGEVTQVLRMTNVHPQFLEESPRYSGSRPFAPKTRENRGRYIYGLSSWRSRPDIEDDQCAP